METNIDFEIRFEIKENNIFIFYRLNIQKYKIHKRKP